MAQQTPSRPLSGRQAPRDDKFRQASQRLASRGRGTAGVDQGSRRQTQPEAGGRSFAEEVTLINASVPDD